MAKKEEQTYASAMKELQTIVQKLEAENELTMDELTQEIQKATELLAFCKKELTTINKDIEKIIEGIE